MYDFLMFLGVLCLLAGVVCLVMFFVRLAQERPAKRFLLGVLGAFIAFCVLAVVAAGTPEGKLAEERRQRDQAMKDAAAEADAPVESAEAPTEAGVAPKVPESLVASSELPKAFKYEVQTHDDVPKYKLDLDVHISHLITRKQLMDLSKTIVGKKAASYETVLLTFLLPEMKAGSGSWAHVTFEEGSAQAQIVGLTAEEQEELAARPLPAGAQIVGVWLDRRSSKSRLTLFGKEGKFTLRMEFHNGGEPYDEAYRPVKAPGYKRYDPVDADREGDHLRVMSDGSLETWEGGYGDAVYLKLQ